jgi:fumarylacetoacetate (FAA) hydrolase
MYFSFQLKTNVKKHQGHYFMKLASLKTAHRDGSLVIVSRNLERMVSATDISPTLREAIENWDNVFFELNKLFSELENGNVSSQKYDPTKLASPLPRAFQWADGSAYLSHMRLVRKARGAEMPSGSETHPLLYQGGGDIFLGPCDPIPCYDIQWGLDFESEIAIITDDVPARCDAINARSHIKLIMLCNDISLRHVMRPELVKGFGFYQSKPASSFSPVCVTPDELGDDWDGGKINLPLVTTYNGKEFGRVEAGKDLNFDFPRLISHAARTRDLSAGTVIGSGTVSNENFKEVGSSCLAEVRMIETIENGEPTTQFMVPGDTIRIEMFNRDGNSIFGAIDQHVQAKQ